MTASRRVRPYQTSRIRIISRTDIVANHACWTLFYSVLIMAALYVAQLMILSQSQTELPVGAVHIMTIYKNASVTLQQTQQR